MRRKSTALLLALAMLAFLLADCGAEAPASSTDPESAPVAIVSSVPPSTASEAPAETPESEILASAAEVSAVEEETVD